MRRKNDRSSAKSRTYGCIARRQRRAVKGQAEDAIAPAQHRAGQATLLFEGDAFRRQHDAIEQAAGGRERRARAAP